ncbi:hypothetical protein ABW19_dt0207829 [Dactylella cylindrospora]|nr:hypothetical protein ABW19_dt0207829 [Dactylella cylindrospora]
MAALPKLYSSFSVTSSCLCFGALHNILSGASVPPQGFPNILPQASGTVRVHLINHNVAALNGTWNAYQLVRVGTTEVAAWFACHSDVNPQQEVTKILRVSGSPYEEDSGSSMNSEDTRRQGVLVINRYDWGYYVDSYQDEVGTIGEEDTEDAPTDMCSAGLVDYTHAREQVQTWKRLHSSRRCASSFGVWMDIPHGEYLFGRFGFDDAGAAARSFLFFSAATEFTRTSFSGLRNPLRQEETHEERFERRLREGYDFSGISLLGRLSAPLGPGFSSTGTQPPPQSGYLGPYAESEYILTMTDFEALLKSTVTFPAEQTQGADTAFAIPSRKFVSDFSIAFKEEVKNLLNEMVCGYLEHFVVPRVRQDENAQAAIAVLLPNRAGGSRELDHHAYRAFSEYRHVVGFDDESADRRIKAFFIARSPDSILAQDDQWAAGIRRVIKYLLLEALELSGKRATDSYRNKVVPEDIRASVYNDRDLLKAFQFSRVYWEGVEDSSSTTEWP